MCPKAEKHIKHFVAGCTTFAPFEYTDRHNKLAAYIHQTIREHTQLQIHIPEMVINVNGTTVMWDILVTTD